MPRLRSNPPLIPLRDSSVYQQSSLQAQKTRLSKLHWEMKANVQTAHAKAGGTFLDVCCISLKKQRLFLHIWEGRRYIPASSARTQVMSASGLPQPTHP